MPETCFFCKTEKDAHALVCPACGRDTAVPLPLAAEHAEGRVGTLMGQGV
ncbi:Fe2+ or Zn2+ uptake regulation protein [Bradyrhizobium sp. AZCC 2176]